MPEMTSQERFARMYDHREADRVPILDHPWGATVERWRREGMPADANWVDYFGLDHVANIGVDSSPRYEHKVLEDTDEYRVVKTAWGATLRDFKHQASAPEFLDFTIKDRDTWADAKRRMTPSRDRINWERLEREYPKWKQRGGWIQAKMWFGFDVTHSWTVGTERLLMALATDPDWCTDMFNHELDMDIALLEMVLDAGYEFDCVSWPDDMGYKGHQFFGLEMYRDLLKPVHRRAIEWAHSRGVRTHLHSCGDIRPFVPELVEIGLDALNPLEVKAGMDPLTLKQRFGDRLVLHGGINAVNWDKPEVIEAEIRRKVPVLKTGGGYIFASDHSIPSSVSLEDFRRIIGLAKSAGAYN